MFEIIKSVIANGGYKLTEIQHKVKKLFLLGDLTEEQMDELLAMASRGISVDAERPETLAMIQTLAAEIEALKARVKDLEGDEPAEPDNPDEPDVPVYPKWERWDGISNNYQYGAIVDHIDVLWISDFRGQNVWEPGAPGTEAMWVIYEK
jgi:hypothetical protein